MKRNIKLGILSKKVEEAHSNLNDFLAPQDEGGVSSIKHSPKAYSNDS